MYLTVSTHNDMENRSIIILIKAGYTLEQIRDILTENNKYYTKELIMNHREYDGASQEKIMELDNIRRDLTSKQIAAKKALHEVHELIKEKEAQKASQQQGKAQEGQQSTPNPAQTNNDSKQKIYQEINQLIYTLLNIKEEEKSQFKYICETCFSMKASNVNTDFVKLSAKIDERNKMIEELCSQEILEINPKLQELFESLTPEERASFEGPSSLVKSSNPVTVKEQYRTIASEIYELELAIHNNPDNITLCDQYNMMINSLVKSISLLKTTLDDPKQFDEIQKEVDKELAKEKLSFEREAAPQPEAPQPEAPQPEAPQPEIITGTEGNAQGSAEQGSGDASESSSSASEEIKEATVTHIDSDEDKEEVEVTKAERVNIEEKQEYLNLIKENNSIVIQINNLIAEEEAIYANGNLTAETMKTIVEKEKRIGELSDRVHNIALQLSDLEYKTMMNKRVFLPDDPSIKETPIAIVTYNKPIEEFMDIHNKNIVEAYKKLQKISDRIISITDPVKKQEFKEKSKETSKILMDYINAEKNMITRRLLAEKKANYDFDIVAFMESNRVDSKKTSNDLSNPAEEISVPTKTPEELTVELEDKLKKLVEILNDVRVAILAAKYEPISLDEQREKEIVLKGKIETIKNEIQQTITSSEYSVVDTKTILTKIEKEQADILSEKVEEIKSNEQEKIMFQKYYRELLEASKTLQALSPDGIEQDGYQEKYIQILNRLKEISKEFETAKFEHKVKNKEIEISLEYEYKGTKKVITAENIKLHQESKVETKQEEKTKEKIVSSKIGETHLQFQADFEKTEKGKAILKEFPKTKLTLYKTQLKIQYTKQLKELLQESQKQIGLVIQTRDNTNSVIVSGTKENKAGQLVQSISNPTEIDSATITITDENGNVVAIQNIMDNPEISEEITSRKSR